MSRPRPREAAPRVPDRAALGGIVFVLRTGCPWRLLPKELGCGSAVTCWRRLRDWQRAGVWERLHETLLNWPGDEAAIDWSRASADSVSVRAKRGANRRAPIPPTAASPAPSTTWSWTATVSRSPSASRRQMPTTRPSCCPLSTPSRPSLVPVADPGGPANARPNCTPTRRMTTRPCAVPSAHAASPPGSPAAGSTPPSDSGGTVGSWGARFPGSSGFAASASATRDEPISSRDYSTWPAP